MSATKPQIAALKRKDIDGMVTDISTALTLERSGDVRILMRFGDLVKDFHIHVIFATTKVIAQRPDALRNFLAGWFDTIAFMRANKAESVDVMDALGSAIRIDTRGREVMRILPRDNDDVNEEWISDKTRHVVDGLRAQRLDQPYIREDGELHPASWRDAFDAIAAKVDATEAKRVGAVVGDPGDPAVQAASLDEALAMIEQACREKKAVSVGTLAR